MGLESISSRSTPIALSPNQPSLTEVLTCYILILEVLNNHAEGCRDNLDSRRLGAGVVPKPDECVGPVTSMPYEKNIAHAEIVIPLPDRRFNGRSIPSSTKFFYPTFTYP